LLEELRNFGTLGVEILPDPNLPSPSPKCSLFSHPAIRDEPRDWFTGFCKHDFLTCGSFFDEPRQMGLCCLDVWKTKSGLV
jgi:hypothetical protein